MDEIAMRDTVKAESRDYDGHLSGRPKISQDSFTFLSPKVFWKIEKNVVF